jgi:hypothetical protein
MVNEKKDEETTPTASQFEKLATAGEKISTLHANNR